MQIDFVTFCGNKIEVNQDMVEGIGHRSNLRCLFSGRVGGRGDGVSGGLGVAVEHVDGFAAKDLQVLADAGKLAEHVVGCAAHRSWHLRPSSLPQHCDRRGA